MFQITLSKKALNVSVCKQKTCNNTKLNFAIDEFKIK